MKTGPAPKFVNGKCYANTWVAVQMHTRSEAVVFGTLRGTRRAAKGSLANLLMNEVDASSDMPSEQRGRILTQVEAGTYDNIVVGRRRFRIVRPMMNWWAT